MKNLIAPLSKTALLIHLASIVNQTFLYDKKKLKQNKPSTDMKGTGFMTYSTSMA